MRVHYMEFLPLSQMKLRLRQLESLPRREKKGIDVRGYILTRAHWHDGHEYTHLKIGFGKGLNPKRIYDVLGFCINCHCSMIRERKKGVVYLTMRLDTRMTPPGFHVQSCNHFDFRSLAWRLM